MEEQGSGGGFGQRAVPSSSSAPFAPRGGSSRGSFRGARGAAAQDGSSSSSSRGARGRGAPRARPFANKSVTFNASAPSSSSSTSSSPAPPAQQPSIPTETAFNLNQDGPSTFTPPAGPSSFHTTTALSVTPFTASPQPSQPSLPAANPQPAPPKLALSRKPAGTSSSGSNTPHAHLSSDEGSGSSTDEEERKKRFQSAPKNNRFLEMKKQRPALREKYIQEGILPDPLKPQQLSDAAKFKGNCMEMCPEFEREEREFQGEGDELEVFPGTTKLDPAIAVKIYRRPAAGRELPLPEDVRPPEVLRQTLDYLLHKVVPRSPDSDRLANVQGFVWNRTRAIRQDFIVQGEAGPLTIECHERIARWHILSLHWRGGSVDGQGKERDSWPADRDPWSKQQELEQLAKTLTSLNEFYDDLRLTTGEEAPSPNEAEFRAYHLILNIFDPEVLRVVELLPEPVFDAPILQTAIRMRSYAQRSNRGGSSRANALNTDAPMNFFSRFFAEIKSPQVPYLLACMLENQFSQVREGALKALSANYNKAHRGPTLSFVKEALGADSEQEVARWAEECDIEVLAPAAGSSDGSGVALKLHKQRDINFSKANLGSFSLGLVEAKRGASTSQQIVDGGASYAAPLPSTAQASTGTLSSAMSFAPSALKPTPPPAAASSSAFGSTAPKLSPFAAAFQPKGADPSQTPSQQPSASTPSFFAASTAPAPAAPANKQAFPKSSTSAFSFTKPETAPAAGPSKTPSFGGSAFGSSSAWQPTTQQPQPQPQPQPEPQIKAFSPPAPAPQAAPASSAFASGPAPSSSKRSQPEDTFAPQAKAKSPPRAPVKTASTKEIITKLQRRLLDEVVASQSQKIAQEALAAEVKRRNTIARGDILDSLAQRLLNQLIAGEEDEEEDEGEPAAIRKLAAEAAHEAFAVEWCRRTTLRTKLDRWVTKMEMKREEQRQRARFEYVRQRVRERGLIATTASRGDEVSRGGGMRSVIRGPGGGSMDSISTAASTSLSSTSASLLSRSRPLSMSLPLPRAGSKRPYEDEDEDQEMDLVNEEDSQLRRSFIRFEMQRTHLWAEGTFFASIARHIADLASRWRPTGMTVWNVALALGVDESASQQWLNHKFGFPQGSGETERSIHVAKDLAVQAQLLEVERDEDNEGSDVAMMDRCHPFTGLVVFPLSPALASKNLSHKEAERLWRQEAERLGRLVSTSSQGPLWGNRFAPYLLILDWAADNRGGARETLSRLGLTSKSDTSSPWKAADVVCLGGSGSGDGDIDALFSRAVSRSVKDFPLLRHPLGTGVARRDGDGAHSTAVVTTLEELVATVQRPWYEALVGVEALLARLPSSSPSSPSNQSSVIRAAVESATTLLVMANHGISALVNNAETLFEEGEEEVEEVLFLPRPDVDAFVARLPTGREVTVDEALRRLGREVVKELVARDERNEVARGGEDGEETANVSRSGPSGGLLMAQAILSSPSSSSTPFPLATFLSSLTASRLELLADQYFLCVRADEDDGSHNSKERVEAEAGRMSQWGKRAVSILEGKIREATKDGHVVGGGGGGGGGKRRTSSLGATSGRNAAGGGKVQKRAQQQQGTNDGGSDKRGGEEDFAPSGDVAKLRRLIASANSLLSSSSSPS